MGAGQVLVHKMLQSGTYDPETLGARCDKCVLRQMRVGGPIAPEMDFGNQIAIVAEAPGEQDVARLRPLVGSSGMEFNNALSAIGASRKSLNIHQALCCRPPENDLDKVMLKWQRGNKTLEEPLPSPIECCRPRLMNELDGMPNVITLGKVAYQAVTQRQKSVMEIRGGPIEGWLDTLSNFCTGDGIDSQYHRMKILPTLHPAFVIRSRRWARAFKSDLSRAFRWFTVGLNWQEPAIMINPSPAELTRFLSDTEQTYAVDLETSFDDPTVNDLRTVGIGTEDAAMVCVLKSIETGASAYIESDDHAIRDILKAFFLDKTKMKVGHNAGYFDQMVIRHHFKIDMDPLWDTILMHRVVEPELPHKLAYVGSIYTDVTSWKENHTATEAKTDKELAIYNGIDCVVTARVAPQLTNAARLRGQLDVMKFDHRVQKVCVGLHENGMFVDRKMRDVLAKQLIADMAKYRKEASDLVGKPINMNSVYQLRDLIFRDWKIQPAEYTKLGDPSTNDESIRAMRSANKENQQAVAFFDILRRYRTVAKEYGTYVRRLIPYGQPLDIASGWQSEDEQDEAERGLIMRDGRIRPDYNAHGTTSGRLSSSNPNAQNFPKHLRKMIIPQKGHVIVGADADQLELRIITAIAQIKVYLEAFADKKDPHAMTAALMFGKNFTSLVPKTEQWDKLRNLSKGIKYASFYGSGDETVHGIITSAEDKQGNLMYPDLTVREVATIRRNWLKGIPELPRFWEEKMEEYRSNGFVIDPILGRRRDFEDGEAFNEIVNHPIQSAGAHIIHMSTFDLLEEIPFGKWGPGTGLISQVHDAVYVECPCDHPQFDVPVDPKTGKPDEKQREFGWCPPGCRCEANWTARTIERHMNREIPTLPGVPFSAKAKIGKTWGDV